jgi:ribonuclease Z
MSAAGAEAPDRHVEIVGPQGLRALLRGALWGSYSNTTFEFAVHELLPAGRPATSGFVHFSSQFPLPRHPWERAGRDIAPRVDGTWDLGGLAAADGAEVCFRVVAAPLGHTVPCVGYVVVEDEYPGALSRAIKSFMNRPVYFISGFL